ncbi:MAG: DsbA family protein [Candidatus Acidiferrales bacterium]
MTRVRRVLGVVLFAAVAMLPLSAQQTPAQKPEDPRERCLGSNPKAPILIEVFSDYECPACRRYYLETMRPVIADYAVTGKACVVYYEFPLQMHKHARQAARYGHAAGRLGGEKWIQVTDAFYYYQAQWAANGELDPVLAKALSGKELAQVKEWAGDPKVEEVINRDVAQGRSRGVTGTPTTFITVNGKTEKLPTGIIQYPILRRYLDNLLAQAQ